MRKVVLIISLFSHCFHHEDSQRLNEFWEDLFSKHGNPLIGYSCRYPLVGRQLGGCCAPLFFLSPSVNFNLLLSIFVCSAASLFFAWMVSAHVFAQYIIAGYKHKLYICLFKHMPILPLKMSWCFANAVHPAVILL